jgi:hypothetical protein
MKNVIQKLLQGWARKFTVLAVGAACCTAVLSPTTTAAAELTGATQLQYLQLLVVLTGEAPWFPANATANDYVQWARNNGMNPQGGWQPNALLTTDVMAETLVELLGLNPRKQNGNYYLTLARDGINLQPVVGTVSLDFLRVFMDNPWHWSKENPPSPTKPKNPKDPKDPKPHDPKDHKDKDHGHKRR